MGEIVSGVATAFLDKLTTKAYQEISLACGLKGDVERLRNSMRITSAYLMDAENRQFEKRSITEWLEQLKDAIYDATVILDEMEYETKRSEVDEMYGSATKKVRRFFSCFNPLAFRLKMAHKIKNINQKIDEITIHGKNLGLTEQHANYTSVNQKSSWRDTGSSVPPRVNTTSRNKEKQKLISSLISLPTTSQSQVRSIDVIPIVGIGGLGKTTLAQMVYNDYRVVPHFDMRMWVCVSDEFDVKRLILNIIKAADRTDGGVDHNSSLNELQSLLCKKLQEKRFLLVLDDVWNESTKKWDDLVNHLSGMGDELKSNGSKIIVTTRSLTVASITGTVPEINMEPLPYQECWELFVKCAFPTGDEEVRHYRRLKEIGRQIVDKCKGLPLAVVTLGCLLKSKSYDESEWKKIRDSELWEIDSKDDGILPALRLSYDHLPSHLKQCFSYCSTFPKDFVYSDVQLISFWMAHGLLQPANEKEEPEYLGKLYVQQLVSASFLQVKSEDTDESDVMNLMGSNLFKMHDLLHDLGMSTMQSERQVRHSLFPNNGDGVHSSFSLKSNKIQAIGITKRVTGSNIATELSVKWTFKTFKCLRVLHLHELSYRLLPDDCFSEMKHLRCLCLLNCDKLEKLPDSICKLHLLQSLFLEGCNELKELPKNMRNLVSLRHLHITVQETYLSSKNLRCFNFLQTLEIFNCIKLVSLPSDIARLTTLKKLIIVACCNFTSFEDEGEEEGKQSEAVKDLSLQVFVIDGSPKVAALPNWLERSFKTLQCMRIEDTSLTMLPEWLPNLTTLNTLIIKNCPELLSLPSGMEHLHSLQNLYIRGHPTLISRCKRDTGPDWPKIAHVQNLKLYFS